MDLLLSQAAEVSALFLSTAIEMVELSLSVSPVNLPPATDNASHVCSRCDELTRQVAELQDKLHATQMAFAEEVIDLCREDVGRTQWELQALRSLDPCSGEENGAPPNVDTPLIDRIYFRNTVTQFIGATLETKRRMFPVLARLLDFDAREEALARAALATPGA